MRNDTAPLAQHDKLAHAKAAAMKKFCTQALDRLQEVLE